MNKKGERFANETISFHPPECANIVDRQPDKCLFALFDEEMKNRIMKEGLLRGGLIGAYEKAGIRAGAKLDNLGRELQLEANKGGVKIADSWDEIADWIGAAPEVLKLTIGEYNSLCDRGYDEVFNKDRRFLQALRTSPYYAIRCTLGCLDTIGGIKINHKMEVLNNQDKVIPGLYAGGDVSGGWESDTYCMTLPGSAFGFAINSGRIAGEYAAKYVSGDY